MASLWLLQQSFEGLETYFRLADRGGTGSLIRNLTDVRRAGVRPGGPQVRPVLAIDDDTFRLDLFEDGITFVSRRLADSMALPADAAEFGEVDDGDCGPAVRRMGYRTLRLLACGDALDHAASDGRVVDWVDGDGIARSQWVLAAPEPNRPAPRARWRTSFEPPAELFFVEGTSWRAATNALAARVMDMGAVGVDFVDPVASAATGDLVTRAQ